MPTTTTAGPTTPAPDIVDFVGDVLTGPAPLTVHFTDLSTGNPDSWLWHFGDGNTSTDQNPTHVYLTEGLKTVSLAITRATTTTPPTTTLAPPVLLSSWGADGDPVDSVGGRDATWTGTPNYGPGPAGFDLQSGAYLTVSDSAIFDFAPSDSFSMTFSTTLDAMADDYHVLIIKQSGLDWGWGIWTRYGELFVKASSGNNLFTVGAGLTTGINYNVKYTYSNGVQKVYINNVSQTLELWTYPEPNYIHQGSGPLWFGSYVDTNYKFTGIIDEIKIYSGLI